jgi:hypothetical protein
MLQAGRLRVPIPDEVIGIFNLANPSSRTMTLGSTHPLPFSKILPVFLPLPSSSPHLSTLPPFYYYYYLVCEAIGTAATPGLLCQPRVIVKMIVEKQMEWRVAGETEVLGENLP